MGKLRQCRYSPHKARCNRYCEVVTGALHADFTQHTVKYTIFQTCNAVTAVTKKINRMCAYVHVCASVCVCVYI